MNGMGKGGKCEGGCVRAARGEEGEWPGEKEGGARGEKMGRDYVLAS